MSVFSGFSFFMAPSLKFLVVSEVTCHRRKNQTNQSSLPRTNTDSLLHKQESSQVTTKYYYICENYFLCCGIPEHLHCRSSNTHPQISPPATTPGVRKLTSYLWPNLLLAGSSGDSKFGMFSRELLAVQFMQFCQN